MLGMSSGNYIKLEEGRITTLDLRAEEVEKLSEVLDRLSAALRSVGEPTLHEKCFLARRRAGVTLHQARRLLGLSPPGYHMLERRGDPRVVTMWESRGYRF